MDFRNVEKAFSVYLSLNNGLDINNQSKKRYLSQMKGMFADEVVYNKMLQEGDRLIYEFYDFGMPENAKDLSFGTSICYPGKVGNEYFMTRGHFHTILDTSEVYYCIGGEGIMMMENPEGDVDYKELTPGCALYVPRRYAHRSICTSKNEPLITFYTFRADAGHDYGTIETKGFRKLVVENDNRATIVNNLKWKER